MHMYNTDFNVLGTSTPYTCGPHGLRHNYFGVQVCTTQLHELFGAWDLGRPNYVGDDFSYGGMGRHMVVSQNRGTPI